MSMPIRSAIKGVEAYHPEKVVTNFDLEKIVDTSDEWIKTRTGIIERRYAKKGEAASDLAVPAITQLLRKKNVKAEEIDLIIVPTVTPDMIFPSTACLIQKKIGATNAWGYDLSAGCSGFVFALATADQFIRSGKYSKVLVIGTEVMTSILNFEDRNTCVLFGDGCGVALLEPEPEASQLGLLDILCKIDGVGTDLLYMPGGGSANPATHDTVDKKMHCVHQEGKQVFKHAVSWMAQISEDILKKNSLTAKDIDLFVAHQANLRIIEACQKKLGIPDQKVVITIDKFANTTSATIPTCLATALNDGRLTKGKLVLVAAFGAGFTAGSALIRWAY